MGDRVEDFREKRLDWLELTPRERERLRLLDSVVEQTRRAVDGPALPDLTPAIMARVRGLEAPSVRPRRRGAVSGPIRFLFARRTVVLEFRVAQLLASAAVVLLLAGGGRWYASPAAGTENPAPVFVQFRLHAPGAARVQLAGSFSEWRTDYSLHETSGGVWVVTVPLQSGIHDYSFVVDGSRWVVDPYAPAVDDGFGGSANRLSLLAPERQS